MNDAPKVKQESLFIFPEDKGMESAYWSSDGNVAGFDWNYFPRGYCSTVDRCGVG